MSSTQQKITDWLRKYKGPRPPVISTETLWMMINLWEHLELLSVNKSQTNIDIIKDLRTDLWREEDISRNARRRAKEHYDNSTRLVEEKSHLWTRLQIAKTAFEKIIDLSFQQAEGGYRAENISHVALNDMEKAAL